jgi:hypothetical protein
MVNKTLSILLVVLAMTFLVVGCTNEPVNEQNEAPVSEPEVDLGISEVEAEASAMEFLLSLKESVGKEDTLQVYGAVKQGDYWVAKVTSAGIDATLKIDGMSGDVLCLTAPSGMEVCGAELKSFQK